MDLRDIEIYLLGLKSLHRQRRGYPCPGAKPFNTAGMQSSAYLGIAAILAAFILAFATAPKARAQDNGHHLHHADHYSKWKQPGTNTSCCNGRETKDGQVTGDCYPTTAEVRAGSWWAKTDDGQWVIVPDDRIIRERNPDVERAHLCFNYGHVLCFVPPSTGT